LQHYDQFLQQKKLYKLACIVVKRMS